MDEREPGLQPLGRNTIGCTLSLVPTGRMYQPMSALAVLAGLNGKGFAGVCECYIQQECEDDRYRMGVALRFAGEVAPEEWWGEFVSCVGDACVEDDEVRLDPDGCSFTSAGELRAVMLHAGTAGFEDGLAVWVSDPAGQDRDSPFTALCRSTQ